MKKLILFAILLVAFGCSKSEESIVTKGLHGNLPEPKPLYCATWDTMIQVCVEVEGNCLCPFIVAPKAFSEGREIFNDSAAVGSKGVGHYFQTEYYGSLFPNLNLEDNDELLAWLRTGNVYGKEVIRYEVDKGDTLSINPYYLFAEEEANLDSIPRVVIPLQLN